MAASLELALPTDGAGDGQLASDLVTIEEEVQVPFK